ncbi:hypothetical protein E0Z10_g8051 [Xylaria hypoxylon]|uniref:F-box domain-containing protein n=1 Tax=Xylaria hypoxylon TaxID=37992 RepID=A0A4Z0YMP2_9PEZI|nr:hypothetical protein E0Z10_g8051 [Xylaria hypoxylon]
MDSIQAPTVVMDHDEERLQCPIKGLPVELLRMILEFLPDASSLYTAVLSCSLFHSILWGAEEAITAQVVLNQMGAGVLPEAMMAFESAPLRPHNTDPKSRQAISDYIVQNIQQRPNPPRLCSLRRALYLSRLHFCVDALAKEFAATALAKHPLSRYSLPSTCQEISRIERALYRFEIYCNLFRESEKRFAGSESPLNDERKSLFFANFAPCENEQLGCVLDFLVRTVSPIFNEVAEHDVGWGSANVDYDNKPDNPYIQSVLSRGLAKIYAISVAETYEKQYRALNATKSPHANFGFLCEGLEYDANEPYNDRVYVEDITPENETRFIKRPFFKDSDPGPANAWRWAHIEETRSKWVYIEDRRELREWGYVMWDQRRLDKVGIFQGPWEDIVSERDLVLEDQEAGREHAYMQNSWEQRESVSMSGGSGWWSWGDRSKVVYKDRGEWALCKRQWGDHYSPDLKPNSRQEARKMLGLLTLPLSARKIQGA